MAKRPAKKPAPSTQSDLGRVVEQVAIIALPASLVAGTAALQQLVAPGGVAPWALLTAAILTLFASGLALIWSRDDIPWRSRHAMRIWILAGLVGASLTALTLGDAPTRPPPTSGFRKEIREVCSADGASERKLQQDLGRIRTKLAQASPAALPVLLDDGLEMIQRTQREEGDLLARVTALQPPDDDEPAHAELIGHWERKLDQEVRSIADAQKTLAAANGHPAAFQAALLALVENLEGDPTDERTKDTLLRKLAGSGCLPMP